VAHSGTEDSMQTHRTRRRFGSVGALAVAMVAAGAASLVTASAHVVVSTTPTPAKGVVGSTALADTASVVADSSRHVVFFLWAPTTCGQEGATPVFTDSEPVTTSQVVSSTVTSKTYVPQQTGTFAWTAEIVITASGSVENGPTACTDEHVTVTPATPSISTTPSNADGAPVGTAITDSAKVTGGFNPTGTVTFALYGPGNPECVNGGDSSLTALQQWTEDLSEDGTANVPSPGFTTTMTGTYNWVATYSGDSNNVSVTSACGDESVVIGQASPTIVTAASEGGPVGTQIHDTAQVSGGNHPTGTVTFFLYPPSDPTCTSDDTSGWVQKETVALSEFGSATSAATPFTTTEAGVYNWIATYSGDANNNSVSTSCMDEQVTIGTDPTAVTTAASAGGVVGTLIHDTAKVTVTGGFNPTGTVTFTLFGPGATKCTGTPLFTSTVPLSGTGSATSGTFSGTAKAGTYNWIATYSGDSDSASSTSKCGAEPVVITASGVQGITTPGTGAAGGITQVGIGLELLLGGLALGLGSELIRRNQRG